MTLLMFLVFLITEVGFAVYSAGIPAKNERCKRRLIVSGAELAVYLLMMLLPGIDFSSYQGEAAQDFVAVFDVLVQLAVQDFDVVLQLGTQRLQAFDRRTLRSGAQGRKDGNQHYAEDFFQSAWCSMRAAWFL